MKHFMTNRAAAYLQFAGMGAKTNFAYRSNIVFQLLGVLVQVYLLKIVWTAVYRHHTSINHIPLQVLLSYLTQANLQTWILTPRITDFLRRRVRTGEIALDMAKPIDFLGQLFALQFGLTLGLIPFVLVGIPLALVGGGMQLPASVGAALLYLVSLFLAYLIVSLIGVLMGLMSMWMVEVTGIQLIYRFVNQFFAGALVPLWFFPPILHTVATLLPFQAIAFLPVSIYLGQLQPGEIVDTFATQLSWIIILYVLTRITWYKAQRHIMVQGG